MAKITKRCERKGTKKFIKTCERKGTKKFIKTCEKTGRKKIAKLLSLMGFHDDDTATTVKIMRERLRQIEERTKIMHEKRSTIKRITIKFGGKKLYLNREEPATKFPLETSISEIKVGCDADNMEIDSSNISTDENHDSEMINFREVDQSFEEKRLEIIKKNTGLNEDGVYQSFQQQTHSIDLPSENPNSDMNSDNDNNNINDFITSIGGSDAVLVIEKKLTKSDCDKNQGRLLIPVLQVKNFGFLTMNEKKKLDIRETISVEVFDPKRRKLTLNLAQWKMKNENYVLKTNWNKLVLANGLRENVVIRVLAFRVDQKLCFAVVRV